MKLAGLLLGFIFLQDVSALRLRLSSMIQPGILGGRSKVGSLGIKNPSGVSYRTNLTLNGRSFSAVVDTSSNEIHVAGTVPNAKDTGRTSGLECTGGPVKTADLELAGFSIPDQEYLEISPSDQDTEGTGLIGLGPSRGFYAVSPLDRIFEQDRRTSNYITVLLGQSDDHHGGLLGEITIDELMPGYESITNQPMLEASEVAHWQTVLDENGIIGPDERHIGLPKSRIANPRDGGKKLTVVFDTGFTFSHLPMSVLNVVYKDIEGAEFRNVSGRQLYTLPCGQEFNLTFIFGGQKYPIRASDSNLSGSLLGLAKEDEDEICFGAFQPISFDGSLGGIEDRPFDIVLGTTFLKSAYVYVNFGDWIEGTSSKANSYIQLMSTMAYVAEEQQVFSPLRLQGRSDTDQDTSLGEASNRASKTKSAVKKSKKKSKGKLSKKLSIIIAIVVAGVIGLVLFCIAVACCRSKMRRRRAIREGRPVKQSKIGRKGKKGKGSPTAPPTKNAAAIAPKIAAATAPMAYAKAGAPALATAAHLQSVPYLQAPHNAVTSYPIAPPFNQHTSQSSSTFKQYIPEGSFDTPQSYISHQIHEAPPGSLPTQGGFLPSPGALPIHGGYDAPLGPPPSQGEYGPTPTSPPSQGGYEAPPGPPPMESGYEAPPGPPPSQGDDIIPTEPPRY